MNRQTYIIEYSNPTIDPIEAFPYWWGDELVNAAPGRKVHLVEPQRVENGYGRTHCGNWIVECEPLTPQSDVVYIARRLCGSCQRRLDDHVIDHLARLCTKELGQTVTPEDVRESGEEW